MTLGRSDSRISASSGRLLSQRSVGEGRATLLQCRVLLWLADARLSASVSLQFGVRTGLRPRRSHA